MNKKTNKKRPQRVSTRKQFAESYGPLGAFCASLLKSGYYLRLLWNSMLTHLP